MSARVAALEMLRHLWLLKQSGSHEVWVLSLPESYRDRPAADLAGKDHDAIGARHSDGTSHFSSDDRGHLSNATQNGLKWVHKAMMVTGDPGNKANLDIVRRWFGDEHSTDALEHSHGTHPIRRPSRPARRAADPARRHHLLAGR